MFLKFSKVNWDHLQKCKSLNICFFLIMSSKFLSKTTTPLEFCCKPCFSSFDMILCCAAEIFQDNYRNIIVLLFVRKENKIHQTTLFFRLLVDQAVTARKEHELSATFFELFSISTMYDFKCSKGFSVKNQWLFRLSFFLYFCLLCSNFISLLSYRRETHFY